MVYTVVRMILFLSEDRNGLVVTVDKNRIIIIIIITRTQTFLDFVLCEMFSYLGC